MASGRTSRASHRAPVRDGVVMVTSEKHLDSIIKAAQETRKPIVFDFQAKWCGPCKQIAPEIEKIAVATPEVMFVKVDVDEMSQLAEDWKIDGMPTFLVMHNGEETGNRIVGADIRKVRTLVAEAVRLANSSGGATDINEDEEDDAEEDMAARSSLPPPPPPRTLRPERKRDVQVPAVRENVYASVAEEALRQLHELRQQQQTSRQRLDDTSHSRSPLSSPRAGSSSPPPPARRHHRQR